MLNDPRYAPVESTLPAHLPPITRLEAQRAARRLFEHFGRKQLGSARQHEDARFDWIVRRCWIARNPTRGHDKGWGRLIHDISHDIFRARHPSFRPHDGGHAQLEREIAEYVVAKGWLAGTLRPPRKPKLSRDERVSAQLARIDAKTKRWHAKLKRAQTALKRLHVQRRAIVYRAQRLAAQSTTTNTREGEIR